MTGKSKGDDLDRLTDSLVEDLFEMADADVLAEFREEGGDPDAHASEMRKRFEKTLIAANKGRLAEAKAGVAAERESGRPTPVIDIAAARAKLRSILSMPNASQKLTLAARKESELSDDDIRSMMQDLTELGVITEDGDSGTS